jgi:hypothetical protein
MADTFVLLAEHGAKPHLDRLAGYEQPATVRLRQGRQQQIVPMIGTAGMWPGHVTLHRGLPPALQAST